MLHYCFCFMLWIFGHEAYAILASGPGINPHPLTGTWTLNHWTTREVPDVFFLKKTELKTTSRQPSHFCTSLAFSTFSMLSPNFQNILSPWKDTVPVVPSPSPGNPNLLSVPVHLFHITRDLLSAFSLSRMSSRLFRVVAHVRISFLFFKKFLLEYSQFTMLC